VAYSLDSGEWRFFVFFFMTLDTGYRMPLSLELSDTKVYEP